MEEIKKISILVIEDDIAWQEIYMEILGQEGLGFYTEIADSYNDAIEKLNKANYDLAIVDLKLPDNSGEKASYATGENILKYISNLNPRPKVLITTGNLDLPSELASLIEKQTLGDEFVFLRKNDYDNLYETLKDYIKRLLHDKIVSQDLWKFGGNIYYVAIGLNGLLKRILNQAIDLTNSSIAHILFPAGKNILKIYVGTGQDPIEYEVPISSSITGKVFLSNHIENIQNVGTEKNYIKPPGIGYPMKSELAIPLFDGEKVIGVLNLESQRINNFDSTKEKISSVFADLILATLLNEQKRREVNVTRVLLNEVLSSTDIYNAIVEQGAKYLGAQIGGILIRENDRLIVQATYPKDLIEKIDKDGFTVNDCISGYAIIRNAIVNVKDVKNEEPYCRVYKSFGMEMKSEMVAPIEIQGKIVGVLNFEHSQRSFFTDYDEVFLADLAKQTSLALEKHSLSLEIKKQAEERLVGEITHRLTNPLGAIRAWVLEIENKYKKLLHDNADLEKKFNMVKQSSIKAMELISLIKDEQGKIYAESIDLKEHLSLAIQDDKIKDKLSSIDLKIELPDDKVIVKADKELWRVFVNLIENSIDALINGTKRIKINVTVLDNNIEMKISDTGRGIPPDNKVDIFKPWYSSKEKTTGLHGMGLPWVKRYIETYGGKIEVEDSKPQQGTTIKLALLRAIIDDSSMLEKILSK